MSAFLFSILMSVMIHDCRHHFGNSFPDQLWELLYTDDTLLVGRDPAMIQRYMQIMANEGRKYGLRVNNAKLEILQIGCNTPIYDGEGKAIQIKESIKYLGAMLHRIGRIDSEISSKIGVVQQEFRALI